MRARPRSGTAPWGSHLARVPRHAVSLEPGESGWIPTKGEKEKGGFARCTWLIEPAEAKLIVSGFNMEHGGKVPRVVIGKCDEWLRKSAAKEACSLVALSEPRDSEAKKIDRMLKRG